VLSTSAASALLRMLNVTLSIDSVTFSIRSKADAADVLSTAQAELAKE